uniref:Uncharacterized protein n=1 Tax=viral metagenome TaxID=1070528 RepID=A0A6C0BKF6_9ZZZZ
MSWWNPFAGTTPDPNQNNLAISSEFSKLGAAIKRGSDTLGIVKQIPGVAQSTIDDYSTLLTEVQKYYNGPAATDTLANINSKVSVFERQTAQFVEKSQNDVQNKVDIDAAVQEKEKEPVDMKSDAIKTAVNIIYWVLYTGFVIWAGSVGSNLAFREYGEKGSYTFFYFFYTALLAGAYSLLASWGIPLLTPYKDSKFIRLMCLIGFQFLCIGIFFSTTVSKGLVFRAWLLPLIEGESRGLFSYGGPRSPLPLERSVVLPLLPQLPLARVEPPGVSALLGAAAVKSVSHVFTAPAPAASLTA